MIANTDNQYLVPTSGNPIRGLIQDHVVAGVWMTCQNSFFEREEYFQLIYGALRPEDSGNPDMPLKTLPPTIWKPKPLWTGKQIVRLFTRCELPFSLFLRSRQSSRTSHLSAMIRRQRRLGTGA